MAWRPTKYLIEGELDNTTPDKVAGWMRFAGLKQRMTFDLQGNFHRDIRGAKIRFMGDGREDDPEAASYMDGMSMHQTGKVGDMTGGREPQDFCDAPYLEWYGNENGRVVIELEPNQLELIGMPIPACESDPISRADQQQNMAEFLAAISREAGVTAVTVGSSQQLVSDPAFTHWVVEQGHIVGEARAVEEAPDGRAFAFVRLFSMPEMAEYGYIATSQLKSKNGQAPA